MRSYGKVSTHESKKWAKYKLFGISHHSGGLGGGHYVAEVQNVEQKQWYSCNDSSVEAIDGPKSNSNSAYVLFYVMKDL